MLLNKRQIEDLPNGTKLKIFLSGSGWEEDFGKVYDVVKINNELREIKDNWWSIEDTNTIDDLSVEVAYNDIQEEK